MDFVSYQIASRTTAVYPNLGNNPAYVTLGICGEAGEIAEKIKKVYRDHNGVISVETQAALRLELGDLLWYLAQLCTELNISLNDVAAMNLAKLSDHQHRNVLHGNGDTR